jgi:lipoprotein-anchoring transpeptidase ErfK/SrfK
MKQPFSLVAAAITLLMLGLSPARAVTPDEINGAVLAKRAVVDRDGLNPFIVKAQILLGRRSISPGVIDGLDGENFRKAVAQFRREENLGEGDTIDEVTWAKLGGDTIKDLVVSYEISKADARYRFAKRIPHDYARQAKMKRLSYTSAKEMFAERFHMSELLLVALNPNVRMSKAGSVMQVASISREIQKGAAVRIEAVKRTGMVIVYGPDERILASYPATIGSDENPSPSGDYTVKRVARNPDYTYDPEKNFQQGRNRKKLTLAPGPNGPVGSVWVALSKPTFGIHGTPEPSKVSKTNSHGCIRLTNWDAEELADLVKPGVPVRFVD